MRPARLPRLLPALSLAVIAALAPLPEPGLAVDEEAIHARAARDGRPNVLVILTDDQRADGTLDVMPKTRLWFEQGGTRFPNAFATTPLCCPGRASLFSGRYAHNHGVLTNGSYSIVQRLEQSSTLQRYLQEAGYRTALVGKFFYSWNLSVPPPYVDEWALFRGSYHDAYFNVNGTGQRVPYSTDFIGEHAVQLLRKFEARDQQPWFLFLGTHAPHLMALPEADYSFAPVPGWAGDPTVLEADTTDKPPWVSAYNPPYGDTPPEVAAIRERQLRTLMSVDDLVGAVSEELSTLDEDRETLAIFLSDNGYLWDDHALGAEKRFPYTPSVRIPFLMRWPGRVTPGATDHRLVANIDVLPTVLGAAGLSPDPAYPVDGSSLLGPDARDRLVLEYWRSPDGGPPGWASVRTDTYQYIEWYTDDRATLLFREYYDLVGDPWQLQNLLADGEPANDPDVSVLSRQLVAEAGCSMPDCLPAGWSQAEARDGNDVRGMLDLRRLAYQRLDDGAAIQVTVQTREPWRPRILRPGERNRLVLRLDLNGDAKSEFKVRIVHRRGGLRAWIMGADGKRVAWVQAERPDRRTVVFKLRLGGLASQTGGTISLFATSVYHRAGSRCAPACVDRAPGSGYGRAV